jgi:hypothetical protein
MDYYKQNINKINIKKRQKLLDLFEKSKIKKENIIIKIIV